MTRFLNIRPVGVALAVLLGFAAMAPAEADSRNACGDELMTEQDDGAPERFCLARLPQPEGGK